MKIININGSRQAVYDEPTILFDDLREAGIEPLKTVSTESGGSIIRLTPDQASRHGFSRAVVMITLPVEMAVSEGGDSIRDAEEGRVYRKGPPKRYYFDAATIDAALPGRIEA